MLSEMIINTDIRLIGHESQLTFNIPITSGEYAPEKFIIVAPAGNAYERFRHVRETAWPAGAVCEEWLLRVGGNPANDADWYLHLLNFMAAIPASTHSGPYIAQQLRVRSGGTAGAVVVHGMATYLEPLIDTTRVTFTVPLTAGEYAPERLNLRSTENIAIEHMSIFNEGLLPTGAVFEHWELRTGADPSVDANYFLARTPVISGTQRGANPVPIHRRFQGRIKSGGTAGSITCNGIAAAKTGRFL